MRILMTTDTIGGVWTFTQELVTGLLRKSCVVTLVSFGRSPNEAQHHWVQDVKSRWMESFHFYPTDIPLEWMQQNERAYAEAEPLLLSLAFQFHPDVFHSNQFCFGALPVHIPKVIAAHSDVLSWHRACRNYPPQDSAWLRTYQALVRHGLSEADAVVAPTHWMLDTLRGTFALPASTHVISNGRTINVAPQRAWKLQAVTAGRLWDEAKGIDTLSAVSCAIPLLIAGDTSCGGAQTPASIGNARLLGPLSAEQICSLFGESAIYICTSRYEPFGLAPLEAALCGCAVLANDLQSLREIWQDGALYFSGPASLSELLHALSLDGELLAQAQARSHTQAQKYSGEGMTRKYLALFERVVSRDKELAYVA